MNPNVTSIPYAADSFCYLVEGRSGGALAVVDPGDARAVLDHLGEIKRLPTEIWLTHKHDGHAAGATELARRFDILVRAPAEAPALNARMATLAGGDRFSFGGFTVRAENVTGHTAGHLVYLVGDAVFCGDVFTVGGCGRACEGAAEELFDGYERVFATLSDATRLFPAHDCADANLRFALYLEPGSDAVIEHLQLVSLLRRQGRAAVPGELGRERRSNPFLRTRDSRLQGVLARRFHVTAAGPRDVFAALRRLRDAFTPDMVGS